MDLPTNIIVTGEYKMDEFTANTIRETIKTMRGAMGATIITNCEIQQFTKYDTTYIRTVLTFADGSKESVECPADKADAYYGFTTCYAKHIAKKLLNKNISDMADYWLITKPKREAEARAKAEIQRAEEQRLTERDKKRREKYRIRMEAIRRKEAYEASKLAEEKYGVPVDWSEK
jgi:hypothetical protein